MSQALCNQAITTALSSPGVAALAGSFDVEPGPLANLTLLGKLTYGSGGTTIDAYVQTSFDNGVTWYDVANFHFTTASLVKAFNLSRATPQTTELTPTSGSIAANTAQDGFIGGKLRVLLISAGTYVGTNLAVYAEGTRLRSP
jgi:hypothetical protein